jgi:hypothetical protein
MLLIVGCPHSCVESLLIHHSPTQLNKAKLRNKSLNITQADSLLDRLIAQAVETGAITTVCSGVELVLYLWNIAGNANFTP